MESNSATNSDYSTPLDRQTVAIRKHDIIQTRIATIKKDIREGAVSNTKRGFKNRKTALKKLYAELEEASKQVVKEGVDSQPTEMEDKPFRMDLPDDDEPSLPGASSVTPPSSSSSLATHGTKCSTELFRSKNGSERS